jgi:hypothetical protein
MGTHVPDEGNAQAGEYAMNCHNPRHISITPEEPWVLPDFQPVNASPTSTQRPLAFLA